MKNNFTDQKMDQMLKKLVSDVGLDDAALDDIADAPQLWWGVQRKIRANKRPASMWNVASLGRWLMFGAPMTVAALLLIAFFGPKPTEKLIEQVSTRPSQTSKEDVIAGTEITSVGNSSPDLTVAKLAETTKEPTNAVKKSVIEKKNLKPQQPRTSTTGAKSVQPEVKSEFIALSYARNPESGQIVRVKVPSSMMVSLGLVASVEKPNNLVNAELLVGDDGMTHAIRFIR